MQASNPYQSPSAAVADHGEQYGDVKLFSASGRLGRVRYIGYSVGLMLLFYLFMILGGVLTEAAGLGVLTIAVVGAAVIGMFVSQVLLTIQRCHDFNMSGWMTLLLIVPLVALIFWIVPGTQGANRFGAPPPPNTTGALVLALIVPGIFVLGIVAAIALPAYQSYVMRANGEYVQPAQ